MTLEMFTKTKFLLLIKDIKNSKKRIFLKQSVHLISQMIIIKKYLKMIRVKVIIKRLFRTCNLNKR
jgi:hypothetical protein